MKVTKLKPSIFILAISIVFLGLFSCGVVSTPTAPVHTCFVIDIALKSGGADVGSTLNKQKTDPDFTLTADVTEQGGAAKTVTWSSSDQNVATVTQQGLVSIVGGGRTSIAATSTSDTTKAASVIVIVPGVVSITLKNGGVDAGGTLTKRTTDADFTLTADVEEEGPPGATLVWSSTDVTVATVTSQGVISIVSDGATTVTAASQDGSKSDSIRITVIR